MNYLDSLLNYTPNYTDWSNPNQFQFGGQMPQYSMFQGGNTQNVIQGYNPQAYAMPQQQANGRYITTVGGNSNYQAPTFVDKMGMFASNPIGEMQGWFNGYKGGDGLLRDADNNILMNEKTGAAQIDPNHISKGDIWSGIGAGFQTALGAYGMFQDIGYKKDLIQNQRNELNFAKEQFAEKQRHRQAIVNMNKGITS